jgi:hypothetical protein
MVEDIKAMKHQLRSRLKEVLRNIDPKDVAEQSMQPLTSL